MTEPAKPFTFACSTPGCTETYRAKPEHFGKFMRCQGCQQKIRIPSSPPAPKATAPRAATSTTKSRTPAAPASAAAAADKVRVRCPHCAASCGIQSDWYGREIECPSCTKSFRVPAVAAAKKAAKPAARTPAPEPPPESVFHSDDVPGFALEDDAGYEIAEDTAPAPLPIPPAPTEWEAPAAETTLQQSPVKRKKKRKNSLQWLEDIVDSPKLMFLFGGLVATVLIVCGFFFAPLAFGMRLIGGLFVTGGFIYALRMAFDESPTCGVFYLLDCTSVYRIYYTVTRWGDMKHAFLAETFGLLLFVPWAVITTEEAFDHAPRFQMGAMDEDDDDEPFPPGLIDRQFGAPGNPINDDHQQPGNNQGNNQAVQ